MGRPCICCTAGGSRPLLRDPAESGRAGTGQRLGWRLLGRPQPGLWARPRYLNSLCFVSPRCCSAVGVSDRTGGLRERRNRRANWTDGAVHARREALRRRPERAGRVSFQRSSAAGCQPTPTQRRRASTISGWAPVVSVGLWQFAHGLSSGKSGSRQSTRRTSVFRFAVANRLHGNSGREWLGS